MTDARDNEWADGFTAGVIAMSVLTVVALILIAMGSTNGDTFVRDGIRYGSVCEAVVEMCGDWYLIGDAVEFVPTPVVIEVVK